MTERAPKQKYRVVDMESGDITHELTCTEDRLWTNLGKIMGNLAPNVAYNVQCLRVVEQWDDSVGQFTTPAKA